MLYKTRTPIREFSGKIIGWLEDDGNGNQRISNFVGRYLGTYEKSTNLTRNFVGKIIAHGNILTSLLYTENGR